MTHHAGSVRSYLIVFTALLLLTAATTAVAFADLGPLNNLAALAIAAFKATLVVLFFMHAKDSPAMTRLVIGAALLWLAILVILTLGDYATRGWLGVPGR